MKKNQKQNLFFGAFAMVEVIFSLFIIAVGLTGSILLISGSLKNSMGTRDQIIASQLAQEGLEIVRNIRDSNWAATPTRETFDNSNFPNNNNNDHFKCRIDYSTTALQNGTNCSNGYNENTHLNLYLKDNYYSLDSAGVATRFRRKIGIVYYDSGGFSTSRNQAESAKISSIVSWSGGDVPADLSTLATSCTIAQKCVYTEDTLTKWAE